MVEETGENNRPQVTDKLYDLDKLNMYSKTYQKEEKDLYDEARA